MTAGKGWATSGFALGISASVAANVAHSYTLPQVHIGDVISSAFWPIALLIAVEIIVRVAWPAGVWWAVVRYGGLTSVALIAAITSYRHMSALLHFYGEDLITSSIGPLAVDGLMVVSSAALLAIADSLRNKTGVRIAPVIGRLDVP